MEVEFTLMQKLKSKKKKKKKCDLMQNDASVLAASDENISVDCFDRKNVANRSALRIVEVKCPTKKGEFSSNKENQ
jgi:hypothetical protein